MLAATGGWVASGSAATVYNESTGTGSDLSNLAGKPTVLTSGTDTVIGALLDSTDRDDHFIITDLLPGGTAQFDFTAMNNDPMLGVFFTFSDPAGGSLFTSEDYFGNASATTGNITVPASGQVKVSVQNVFNAEGGSPTTTWSVSTNDVVPETSVTALAALGALLALRRNRG